MMNRLFTHKSIHAHKCTHRKGTLCYIMCQKRKILTIFTESTEMLCLARIMIHVMSLTSAQENNFSSWKCPIYRHHSCPEDYWGPVKSCCFDEINFRLILIIQVADKYRSILSDLYIIT